MIRISNFGGLLLLIYFWYNNQKWMIVPNYTNVVSQTFLNFIGVLPQFIITFFFLILIIIYIKSFFTNKRNIILYLITLMLFHMGVSITISMLMLEPSTTFVLFQVYHPIPIEFKYHFLETCLNNNIKEYIPQIMKDPLILTNFRDYLKIHLDHVLLLQMNANDLYEYSNKLLYEFSITEEVRFHKTIQTINNLIWKSILVTYFLIKFKILSYFGFN